MFGESIDVIIPGAPTDQYDEQGNPVLAAANEYASDGWAVAPSTAAESSEPFAQQVVVGYALYKRDVIEAIPVDARVRVRGVIWAVTGQLGDWKNPDTGFEGTVLNVKAVG